ncbi:kinesin-like nuclear fusion protein [Mortierella sp. GBA30]|nr:kinesin-like nuclear fusion protein [Mortierella sp. GBA30]
MENKSAPPTELNRSVSKLKPPSTITRSNSSSALSTALALAAAAQKDPEPFVNNRILNNSTNGTAKEKDNTLTLEMLEPLPAKTTTGTKRKIEEDHGIKQTARRPLATRPVAGAGRPVAAASKPVQRARPVRATTRAPIQTQASSMFTAGSKAAATRGIVPARPSNVAATARGKKKRPIWDLKGRLQDMEELTKAMQLLQDKYTIKLGAMTSKLDSYAAQVSELESGVQDLENETANKDAEKMEILRKTRSIERERLIIEGKHVEEIRALELQQSVEKNQVQDTLSKLQREQDTVRLELERISAHLEQQSQENATLQSTISTQSSSCLAFESDNRALKLSIERTEDIVSRRGSSIETLEKQLHSSQARAQELQQKIDEEELARRRLYDIILDLKSTVRVFCRVRPTGSSDAAVMSIQYPDLEGKEILLSQGEDSPIAGDKPRKMLPFMFDRIFQPDANQADVFGELSRLVQSTLEGCNVTVLAYGQTGSGKTYTMEGPLDAAVESIGLIPRTMLQLYQSTRELDAKGWSFTLNSQYLEVHNEAIYDLLAPEKADTTMAHEIRHCAGGSILINGLTTVAITSAERIASVLKTASHRRYTASLQSADRDSQSHRVFILKITGSNPGTGESTNSTLSFVDLAGSECLADCQEHSSEESPTLHQGLKSLRDVFVALTNKDPHAPYRSSKVTRILCSEF